MNSKKADTYAENHPPVHAVHAVHGDGEAVDTLVRGFLADPPKDMRSQLKKCRANPERHLNPLASAISCVIFGSPGRWREVRDVLPECLGVENG